jgi:hypothetical protein
MYELHNMTNSASKRMSGVSQCRTWKNELLLVREGVSSLAHRKGIPSN